MPKISQIDEVPCQAEVRILQKITLNLRNSEKGKFGLKITLRFCLNLLQSTDHSETQSRFSINCNCEFENSANGIFEAN